MLTDEERKMIEAFQCSGCTSGHDTYCCRCKVKRFSNQYEGIFDSFYCENHSAGTLLSGTGKVALGLPKGFNKVGALSNCLNYDKISTNIRCYLSFPVKFYNYLNIPVWARELDGYLFVRTYCPRINVGYVDVIKGGELSNFKSKLFYDGDVNFPIYDVDNFIDDID